MTTDNQETDKSTGPESTSFEKRRTLLLAAAATPIVATLYSGSARAATSVSCADNTGFVEPWISTGDPADVLRVSARRCIHKSDGSEVFELNGDIYDALGNISNHPDAWRIGGSSEQSKWECTDIEVALIYSIDSTGCATLEGAWPQLQMTEGTPLYESCMTSLTVCGTID